MTYSELQDAIASWCQRDDLSSIIPTWVTFATSAFNRKLRSPEMESRDQSTIDEEYTALPDDFLEIISIVDSDSRELRYMGRQQFAAIVAAGGTPDVPIYTIEDYQLRVYPAPTVSESLLVTILYYEQIAPLVDAGDTNWLLTDYPDAYLYGALIHARAWLHDDDRLGTVKALHEEAVREIKARKVAATGITYVVSTDVPSSSVLFDITQG